MPYYDQYGSGFDEMGGNAARDYAQYVGSSDFQRTSPGNPFAALARLFGHGTSGSSYAPGQIQNRPLPPLPGTTESSYPFGAQAQPQASAPSKPATQLASAQAIADRISRMVGGPQSARPVDFSSFFPQGLSIPGFQQNSSMMPYTGVDATPAPGASPFDIFHMGRHPHIRQRIVMHAEGGRHLPGFMRGGYPELYNTPVRRTFDSGGQNYVGQGDGSGRADNINARLSPNEYVVDAETMALLGDGNPDEGAKKMDTLRANIRKQKGKNLAKGKISPNAKPASAYIAGNPLGTGLNRMSTKL